MTDHSKDEPVLSPRLLDAARAHHEPPPAPREELWGRIQAGRKAAPRRTAVRPLARPAVWVPVAIAATLLVGFALGRIWPRLTAGVKPQVAVTTPDPSVREDKFAKYAAQQTLGQAEVLLTQFRADSRAGSSQSTSPAEARRLLLATRLLLDSPSLTDPRLRGLLEDLELVLSQISEGSTVKEDRAVITEGLDRRDVLPRLRAATPVGTGVQLPGAI